MALLKETTLIPVKRGQCKACECDNHADIIQALYDNRINNDTAAKQANVSLQVWYRHLKYCVRHEVESAIAPDIGNIAKTIIDKVDELIGQIDRLKANTERVNKAIELDDQNIDVKKMQSYVMLERQLTVTLETLAKFTGELNNSAVINVNNTKIEFNNFRENVLGLICPKCKANLIDKLD